MNDIEPRRERFEELFRALHPAVRAYARRRAPAEAVDDVVAETFLVVWRRLEQVPDEPTPWVLTVARNVIGTELRGRRRRLALSTRARAEPVAADDPRDPPGDERLTAALAQLSEGDREALTLIAWDDLSPAEAAASLGIPAARFRVRLHRASRRLRAAAEPDGVPHPDSTTFTPPSRGAIA